MEKMPDTILDAVRLDAINKLKNSDFSTKEQQNKVIDAAKDIMKLADLARKEGLLALEDMAKTLPSDFLRQLILLVVDGNFPDTIAEIGTNIYWTKESEGADAMAYYMYLRGMLGIQNGDNPRALEGILVSLMPAELHSEYRAQMEVLHDEEAVEKLSGHLYLCTPAGDAEKDTGQSQHRTGSCHCGRCGAVHVCQRKRCVRKCGENTRYN